MDALMKAIADTPTWVWAVFGLLMYMGWRRTRPRVVRISRVFLLPAIIAVLAVEHLARSYTGDLMPVFVWLGAAAIGVAIGVAFMGTQAVKVDRNRGLVEMPGTWIYLVVILLIFATRYAFGYLSATEPDVMGDPRLLALQSGFTGFVVGWLVGRTGATLWRFNTAPQVQLSRD